MWTSFASFHTNSSVPRENIHLLVSTIEVPRDVRNSKIPETCQFQEWMVSTFDQMQVPNGTGPGVRKSKLPLLASRSSCTCPRETSIINKPIFGLLVQKPHAAASSPYLVLMVVVCLVRRRQRATGVRWRVLLPGQHRADLPRRPRCIIAVADTGDMTRWVEFNNSAFRLAQVWVILHDSQLIYIFMCYNAHIR